MRPAAPPGRKRCGAKQAFSQASRSAPGHSERGRARIFSGMVLLPGRSSLGRVAVYEARNHLTEEASSLKALEPNIKVPGGGDAAMAEHSPDQLVIAGVCLEHDIRGRMPELMRRNLQP